MAKDSDLEAFRIECANFISAAKDSGEACPAYGAILPPVFHQDAMRWQRYCYDSGWAGIHWPSTYGGRGLSRKHNVIWHEECAKAEIAPYLNLQGLVLAGEAILRCGTPEQKEMFLRPTLMNEILWCQLFSEPGAGSDLAGLQSSAVADGDYFVLNGQKVWSSNAQFAQFGILMARTDSQASKHKGISFFLLDMKLSGIDVRPLKQMTGDHEFCEVFFDDVMMPKNALLGELHGGWSVAMAVLEDERSGAGSADVISLSRRLQSMTNNAKDTDSLTRQSLTSLLSRGRSLQSLLEERGSDPMMAPIAKLLNTEIGYDEAQIESRIRGPLSMLDGDATDRLLYSPGMRIAGGSSEIQRNIIGERILGLPREPQISTSPEA
jgi:alkylation response protein AidB-like acyl-CoA dehydrogenase|tara:strand:+ start:13652 stop:14788 length:1137 start_codon:yes stop_codon:yes gene_type:complete